MLSVGKRVDFFCLLQYQAKNMGLLFQNSTICRLKIPHCVWILYTTCSRRLVHYDTVSCHVKVEKTSWTNGMYGAFQNPSVGVQSMMNLAIHLLQIDLSQFWLEEDKTIFC